MNRLSAGLKLNAIAMLIYDDETLEAVKPHLNAITAEMDRLYDIEEKYEAREKKLKELLESYEGGMI